MANVFCAYQHKSQESFFQLPDAFSRKNTLILQYIFLIVVFNNNDFYKHENSLH